jgi:hypothetical protein
LPGTTTFLILKKIMKVASPRSGLKRWHEMKGGFTEMIWMSSY